MNSSFETPLDSDYTDKFGATRAKVIIHDADVQEIINMMQEDLNLEKLNDQIDVVTRTDELIKLPAAEYEDEVSINLNGEEDDDKGNSETSGSNVTKQSDQISCPPTRENTYDQLNETEPSPNVEKFELIVNEDEQEEEEDFEIEQNNDDSGLVEFIEKAKDFNANALDLSRKNIMKIPAKLLELNQLKASYCCCCF